MSQDSRLNDVVVICPIVYGSVAYSLGKRAEETATHKWTIFVRGPNNEDLSTFLAGVAFTLHPSFAEQLRYIKEPPFEVTELGWGEFEVGIRLVFRDPTEQPIDLSHHLKLYPPQMDKISVSKKPVVSEVYDEVVFTAPHEEFYKMLMLYKKSKSKEKSNHLKENYAQFDDVSDLQQLAFIDDHFLHEIETAKRRLIQLDNELQYLTNSSTTATGSTVMGGHPTTSSSNTKDSDSGPASSSVTHSSNPSTDSNAVLVSSGVGNSSGHSGGGGPAVTKPPAASKKSKSSQLV